MSLKASVWLCILLVWLCHEMLTLAFKGVSDVVDWYAMERILNEWLGFVVVIVLAMIGISSFLWRCP